MPTELNPEGYRALLHKNATKRFEQIVAANGLSSEISRTSIGAAMTCIVTAVQPGGIKERRENDTVALAETVRKPLLILNIC